MLLFKKYLIDFLKGRAVKAALKFLLGSVYLTGFKAWLVKFIVTELFEEIAEPIIKAGVNHVGYLYYRAEGAIIIKKIEKAKVENNESDYNNSVDAIFRK